MLDLGVLDLELLVNTGFRGPEFITPLAQGCFLEEDP